MSMSRPPKDPKVICRLKDAASAISAGAAAVTSDPEANALALLEAVAGLLPKPGCRALCSAAGTPLIPPSLVDLVDQAFDSVYTIESNTVITSVVALWDQVMSWLLDVSSVEACTPADTGMLEHQLMHLMEHKGIVGPLVVWYTSFAHITSANTLPTTCCAQCLALLVYLIVSVGTSQGGQDSIHAPDPHVMDRVLGQDVHVRAAAGLMEAMKQCLVPDLLVLEQQHLAGIADTNPNRNAVNDLMMRPVPPPPPLLFQHMGLDTASKPPIHTTTPNITRNIHSSSSCTTCQNVPTLCLSRDKHNTRNNQDTEATDTDADTHVPYSLQVYHLILWLLQLPCLDESDWQHVVNGKMAYELVSEGVMMVAGTSELLQSCMMSTLAGLVQVMAAGRAPGARKASTGGRKASKATKSLVHTDNENAAAVDVMASGTASGGAGVRNTSGGGGGDDSVVAGGLAGLLPHGQVRPCRHLHEWLWGCSAERVLDMLAHAPGMSAMVSALMMAGAEDRDLGVALLGVLQLMYGRDVPSHVQILVELLRPEANCAVEVRLQAIAAMQSSAIKAIPREDEVGPEDRSPHHVAASLWSCYALDVVLFSIMHDPSPKVRRAAVKLVSVMGLPQCGPGADDVNRKAIRVLFAKANDRDVQVRRQAVHLLLNLPPSLVGKVHYCSPGERLALLLELLKFTAPEGGIEVVALANKMSADVVRAQTRALIRALLTSSSIINTPLNAGGGTDAASYDHPLLRLLCVSMMDSQGHLVLRDALVALSGCVDGQAGFDADG